MTRLSTDGTGFTPDASDDDAMARHIEKHPEDEGCELVIYRDDASVQVRRKEEDTE